MKPTYEEYLRAKEIIREYEREERVVDLPVLVGYLNRKIGYKGYKTCLAGHPVFSLIDRYFIEIEPEGGKVEPCRVFFKRDLLDYAGRKNTLHYAIDFIV